MGTEQIKILFLAANPEGTGQLNLEDEYNRIYEVLNSRQAKGRFRLFRYWKVRRDELQELLLDYKPHILHFSGHGDTAGRIVLETKDGKRWDLDEQTFRTALASAGDSVKLVCLNACFSHLSGQVLSRLVDCVIGMSTAVYDKTAITFSETFYRGLGSAESIQASFDQARAQILLNAQQGQYTPQILPNPRANDPRDIVPVRDWIAENSMPQSSSPHSGGVTINIGSPRDQSTQTNNFNHINPGKKR